MKTVHCAHGCRIIHDEDRSDRAVLADHVQVCPFMALVNEAEPETFECKTGGTHLSAEGAKKCCLPANVGGGQR